MVDEAEGSCTCPDQPRAPQGRCKHRLAGERTETAAARVAGALAGA